MNKGVSSVCFGVAGSSGRGQSVSGERLMRRRRFSRSGVLVVSVALATGLAAAQPVDAQSQSSPSRGICTTATPSPFGSNVMMNCDSTVLPHIETSIAVDPTNPKHLVAGSIEAQKSATFLRAPPGASFFLDDYYTSFDGGATWLNGKVPFGKGVSHSDPTVAFDSQGRSYYGMFTATPGGPDGFDESWNVSRSDDGGVHFGPPVMVDRNPGDDEGAVAADSNPHSRFHDNVYLTWEQFQSDASGAFLGSPTLFSASHDAGQSWSRPVEISGSNAALCAFANDDAPADGRCRDNSRSRPVVGPDGTIYVSFISNQADVDHPTRVRILVVKSTDGGLTWSAPVAASDIVRVGEEDVGLLNNSAVGLFAGESLAVDPNNSDLYIVWPDNRNGTIDHTNADVFFVKSTNGGAHWSAPRAVSTATGDQFFPYAAVAPDGTLNVMFHDRSYDPANSKWGITLARLRPGSSNFALQRVDTGLSDPNHSLWFSDPPGGQAGFWGDYDGLAVGSDGVAHPIWTDMRRTITVKKFSGTTQDIMTAAVP
jgi:hypothetical protein